jgi:hypothetical protein
LLLLVDPSDLLLDPCGRQSWHPCHLLHLLWRLLLLSWLALSGQLGLLLATASGVRVDGHLRVL